MNDWRQILSWRVQNSYSTEEMLKMIGPYQVWKFTPKDTSREDVFNYLHTGLLAKVIKINDPGALSDTGISDAVWHNTPHQKDPMGSTAYIQPWIEGTWEFITGVRKQSWQVQPEEREDNVIAFAQEPLFDDHGRTHERYAEVIFTNGMYEVREGDDRGHLHAWGFYNKSAARDKFQNLVYDLKANIIDEEHWDDYPDTLQTQSWQLAPEKAKLLSPGSTTHKLLLYLADVSEGQPLNRRTLSEIGADLYGALERAMKYNWVKRIAKATYQITDDGIRALDYVRFKGASDPQTYLPAVMRYDDKYPLAPGTTVTLTKNTLAQPRHVRIFNGVNDITSGEDIKLPRGTSVTIIDLVRHIKYYTYLVKTSDGKFYEIDTKDLGYRKASLQLQSWQIFLGDIDPADKGIMATFLTADDDDIVALLCIPSDDVMIDIIKAIIDSGFPEIASIFGMMAAHAKDVAREATEEYSNVMRVEEVKKYYSDHYPNDELHIISDWLKVKETFKEIVQRPDKEASKLSWQDSSYGGKYDVGDLVFDPLSKRFGKVTFVGPLSKVEGMDKGKKIYLTKYQIRNEKKGIPSEEDPIVMLLELSVGFAQYEGNIQSPDEYMAIDPPNTVLRGLTSGVKKVKKLPEEGDSHEDIFETPSYNHTYYKDAGLPLDVVGQGLSKLSWQIHEDLVIYPYPDDPNYGYCIGILQPDHNKENLLAVKRLDSAKVPTALIELAFDIDYGPQLWEKYQQKELDYILPEAIVDRFGVPDRLQHLTWLVQPEIPKVGDKVKLIASKKKLKDLDISLDINNAAGLDQDTIYIVEEIMDGEMGTMGIYNDNKWLIIRAVAMGAGWWLPYHHWREFIEIVESKEASLTLTDKEEWLQIIQGE